MNTKLNCPLPMNEYDRVLLAHGSGGTLSNKLYTDVIFSELMNEYLYDIHDSAVVTSGAVRLAFTTDSYVVKPIFFPGGDIGKLAVFGTVNDLAVVGAKPRFISCSFIIEEGLLMSELKKIVRSIFEASVKANVKVVTGDTKVVEKGQGDKIFINTSGIGIFDRDIVISPKRCKKGDVVIINGYIGNHGIAVMLEREGVIFESNIESDSAPLNGLISNILDKCMDIHMMRDATRGGVASVLNEIAKSAKVGILLYEENLPVREDVKSACEIMGFDPLYVANEGKVIVIADASDADKIVSIMKQHELGKNAAVIGEIISDNPGIVTMKTVIGTTRIVDMISGEQLPRIC
ncbi:MAG: hydrogenase expression/formation protein HypE [Ignavibacteria bacterium]